jgi:hypothetical protein
MPSTLENRDWLTVPLGVLGLLLHLVVGYFYLVAGLAVPLGGVIVLWLIWVALMVVGVWLLVTRPLLTLLVPVVALALYFAAIMLGGALFGWTA